jgi:hypothetical protein
MEIIFTITILPAPPLLEGKTNKPIHNSNGDDVIIESFIISQMPVVKL